MEIETLLKGLMFFGLALLTGIGRLMSARNLDRANYITQKVTPLSLHMVNEHDDVWLKGVAECDAPLKHPLFDHVCLFYDYLLDEDVNFGKKKKLRWKTVEQSSKGALFFLRDGGLKIQVDGNDAEFKHLTEDCKYEGPRRHSFKYFPYPSAVNVVGSVSEGKTSLEKRANIPLIVTAKNREDYVRRAERKEAIHRVSGIVASWVGMTGFLAMLALAAPNVGIDPKGALALAVAAPATIFALYWGVSKYNTFVIYGNRIDNAWSQVDVDLSMRYELIPKLVESAKGYMKHERELLESLGRLRNLVGASRESKLHTEGEAATTVQQTVARIEENPDLKAQGTVSEVTQQMYAIEEKIAHGREIYNGAVLEYNDNVKAFPQAIVARFFGFGEHAFFSAPEEKMPAPELEVSDVE